MDTLSKVRKEIKDGRVAAPPALPPSPPPPLPPLRPVGNPGRRLQSSSNKTIVNELSITGPNAVVSWNSRTPGLTSFNCTGVGDGRLTCSGELRVADIVIDGGVALSDVVRFVGMLPPSMPPPATPPSSPPQCATGWDLHGTNCFQAFASSSYCSCSGCGCPDMWTFCASQHLSSSVATDNEFTTWRTQNPGYVCQGTNRAPLGFAGGTSCYFPTSTCQDGVFDGDCSGSSHKLLRFPQGTVWGWIAETNCCDTSRNVLCVYSSS